MRRFPLPYWAFMPTLGVWPEAGTRIGPGADAAADAPYPSSVAVNLDSGEVTVRDERPVEIADGPQAAAAEQAVTQPRQWAPVDRPMHPNTPSVGGPSWLRKTTVVKKTPNQTTEPPDTADNSVVATARPVTKIYLKPSAKAKAGARGVALSNPISTAVVRRGDTVSIEYLPDSVAEVGEGGVAISRPELIIHLVD